MRIRTKELHKAYITIEWDPVMEADCYKIYWSDKYTENMVYKEIGRTRAEETWFRLHKSTHHKHYFKVEALKEKHILESSEIYSSEKGWIRNEQLEKLDRGEIAVKTQDGIFLGWRFFKDDVTGYTDTGLTGTDFVIYRNDKKIAVVTDSTNYLDRQGGENDRYRIVPLKDGREEEANPINVGATLGNYIDLPLSIPKGGTTKDGVSYSYTANDMSVGDVDGDGRYEFFVKWDPSNSHDNSHRGYTGNCIIDCYKLDGTLLWRLDMGCNIRAGAHYTQFMVYDFNGDQKAEMAVKTAPGTKIIRYREDGSVKEYKYITMPKSDLEEGYSHEDNYAVDSSDYREDIITLFMEWRNQEEVQAGQWPKTLEECFSIVPKYQYPLNKEDASELADYFIHVYAKKRSEKNWLEDLKGFIYKGPEYLTMFSGDGDEIETIPYPYKRVDDGLRWGDYASNRIEPCNRVDRFLSGVAYLDGIHPYLIMCRGYYTRTTIAAYSFRNNRFEEYFMIDSGFVPMKNPFNDTPHLKQGADKVYGALAGQGNHSLSTADVDGDGCQEIIYGGAVIDHDGSLLYSCYGTLPDGRAAKFGHGDALHAANIDPDKPGLEIFSVFEGGEEAPYGYALRDAGTGEVIFGEYAKEDLGRCMIGDICKECRGLQTWVVDVRDCKGNRLNLPLPGTNQNIKWAADLTTQVLDGPGMEVSCTGKIKDPNGKTIFTPKGTLTNNGTKGNPCLVADIFGDFREELLLRLEDNCAIRIYTNCEITDHKLYTLMHDIQYRTGIAWQNNCYNQPAYPEFYYGSDMEFHDMV